MRAQRIVLGWALLGLAAFVLLPWYFPQNLTLWQSLPGVFGGADTASGLVQALRTTSPGCGSARPGCCWRWRPGALPAGPAQGRLLLVGAGVGLAGLLAAASASAPRAGPSSSWRPGSARCPAGSSASGWAARWCCCRC